MTSPQQRLLDGDPTLFEGATAQHFLGWLNHPTRYLGAWLEEIEQRLPRRHERTLLFGMGGSSSPAMFFADSRPGNTLHVLDTSNPDTVAATDFSNCHAIASSKSGGTIETQSLLAHALANGLRGEDLIVITDPGTVLEAQGRELGALVVHGDPECGGRFSSLSPFGLVPAMYAGWTSAALREELAACAVTPSVIERAWADAQEIAQGATDGRGWFELGADPITVGGALWLEQLVAETTGKDGRGFVPVLRGRAATYAPRDMMHWHLVASLLAWHVHVDPFDQPNVEAAKKNVFALLTGPVSWSQRDYEADALYHALREADYVTIQAYAPVSSATALVSLRDRVSATYGTTTANLGPRYLHSTGQLHKGGPASVVGVQVIQRPRSTPTAIAGQTYSFHDLHMAQAQGDFEAMRSAGRPVFQLIVDDFEHAGSLLAVAP